jgi:hypothetical protein
MESSTSENETMIQPNQRARDHVVRALRRAFPQATESDDDLIARFDAQTEIDLFADFYTKIERLQATIEASKPQLEASK